MIPVVWGARGGPQAEAGVRSDDAEAAAENQTSGCVEERPGKMHDDFRWGNVMAGGETSEGPAATAEPTAVCAGEGMQ